MSANPAQLSQPPSQINPPNVGLCTALVSGRIGASRRIPTQSGSLYLTLLTIPAPDEYSSPQTLELRSRAKLGERDGDYRGKVRISGYRRSYKSTDKQTGEITNVTTADMRLEVIE